MSTLLLRRYRPCDADAVSQLFREIYGNHYGKPDIYLPNMISQKNAQNYWYSIVAMNDARVLGHAALCRDPASSTAEMALMAVHPDVRGQNVATRLGWQLMALSESLKFSSLSIKQVTHHPYTQRMAEKIGFHNTGLLPDYVHSPFSEPLRETMVVGCHMHKGHSRPIPDLQWPTHCREFMQRLGFIFGTHQDVAPCPDRPMQIEKHHDRFEILIYRLNKRLLDQICQLPSHWLISAKLKLSRYFAEDFRSLSTRGFFFTGLMPTQQTNGWFALFHRGVQPRELKLQCRHMQQLHEELQRNTLAGLQEKIDGGHSMEALRRQIN